jgi:hypothetical protein
VTIPEFISFATYTQQPGHAVSVVTGLRLDVLGIVVLFPSGGDLSLLQNVQSGTGAHLAFHLISAPGCFSGREATGEGSLPSPLAPSSPDVTNERNYKPITGYALMLCTWTILPLPFRTSYRVR